MSNPSGAAPKFLLLYSILPQKKDAFLKFVKEGKKNPDGSFATDINGNKMDGVIAWLNNNGLSDTKIYTVEKPDHSLTFIATADSTLPDWHDIPGFQEQFGPNTRMSRPDDLNALILPRPSN